MSFQIMQKKMGSFRVTLSTTTLLFTALSLSSASLAMAGGSARGGGDQCKNEINRDRLALQKWIMSDDAADLDFSQAKVPGWSYKNADVSKSYKDQMLSVLEEGRVIVTCFLDPARIADPAAKKIAEKEGVSYKSIKIGDQPTTCINYEDTKKISHIDCNYDLIMATSSLGDPDYKTVHHEYASIAGVEERDWNPSDFSISNQVSQFRHLESRWVLGAKVVQAGESGGYPQLPDNELARSIGNHATFQITKPLIVPADESGLGRTINVVIEEGAQVFGKTGWPVNTCILEFNGTSEVRTIAPQTATIIADERVMPRDMDSTYDFMVPLHLVEGETLLRCQAKWEVRRDMTIRDLKTLLSPVINLVQ